MPSLGIHLLVADDAFARIANSANSDVRTLGTTVRRFPELAALGAIGPDLLYYLDSGPKIAAAVADVFHFLNKISSVLYEAGTLSQQVGMPNVGNRIKQIGDVVTLAVGTAQTGLLAAIVDLNEVVTGSHLFKPSAQQEEKSEAEWNWGDILHDRISGTFANRLLNDARRDSKYQLMAYASGYMTHLATDFVGHGYVNTVVGGPARGWNMRHTLAEKFMDAAAFKHRNQDINTSKLHARFSSLADTPDLDTVCKTLAGLMDAFAHDSTLGYPLPSARPSKDIKSAFDSMCSLYRMVTEDSYVAPPQGPTIAIPPIPGEYGSLTHVVLGIPPPGRPRSITDWLKFLIALFLLVPSIMIDMVRFLTDIAIGVITYPMAAAVYVLQSFLYALYRQVRWFLVISGVVFPCLDELQNPLALQFIQSRGYSDEGYPHVPPPVLAWVERIESVVFSGNNLDYLNYPQTTAEHPTVRPSIYPKGTTPELFMRELKRDDQFVAAWYAAATPADVRTLVARIPPISASSVGGFGNAADLSVLLLERQELAARLNLDSDRGYGYRQWKCAGGGISSGNITNEQFI